MPYELSPEKVRQIADPALLQCTSTEEISPLEGIVGQDRAVRALKFGLDMRGKGFNVYVAGYPGTGRTTAVKGFLEELAERIPPPQDWFYVNNFTNPSEPRAISLPAGMGMVFQKDMVRLVSETKRMLPEAFMSEEYAKKRDATVSSIEEERNRLFAELNRKAQAQGFALQTSPIGLLIVPVVEGQPMSDEEFLALSPDVRERIEKRREELGADLRNAMRQLRGMEGKVSEELKKLNRDIALYAIGHLVSEMQEKYKDYTALVTYLTDVQEDILENIQQFIEEPKPQPQPLPLPWMKEIPFKKYEVNVIVDNSGLKGAPVIIELNPTYQNIFGRMEKEAQFGVLTTDFTLIQAGSLHRANGGYLVLHAEELLKNLLSYDALKRDMMNQQITIEEPAERLGYMTTRGLKPAPIPLDVKVILVGSPYIYQMLYIYDPDFKELFKIKADFDATMERDEENMRKYAAFVCTLCRKENLKNADASSIAKIVELGSRLAEDQGKLSTRFADIANIIREADFYATRNDSTFITGDHVRQAIEERTYRSNLVQKKIEEMIARGFFLIDTEGEAVGQVNGLSVITLGDFEFGRPSRLTATTSLGREGVIDIEREAQLGGRIHSKGVMILSGYLAGKYAQDKPLSLSARLVFEQSYEGVEGDSASSTELYAILSSLSGLPIRQYIAVTGSVNQRGEVQAIGGVNEKIEGYFEVCKLKGLSGKQGVMIPQSNVQNLMLKEEIVQAVREGRFHIYPVKTIDEGVEILTGVRAGAKKPDGSYEEGTVNHAVNARLGEMARKLSEFPEFVVRKEK